MITIGAITGFSPLVVDFLDTLDVALKFDEILLLGILIGDSQFGGMLEVGIL